MDIRIVLLVVDEHMIIQNDGLALLSVVVPRSEHKSAPLRVRIFYELKQLTVPVKLRDSLRVLEKVSRIDVHQLDLLTVEDLPTENIFDVCLVVDILVFQSLFEDFPSFILSLKQLCALIGRNRVRILVSLLHDLFFSAPFFECVVLQTGYHLENHRS